METKFDLKKFFRDVFNPDPGEILTFLMDLPHPNCPDNDAWAERRQMAAEWRRIIGEAAYELGVNVNPFLFYPATGSPNADLPAEVIAELKKVNMVIAMTQFSATAPLVVLAGKQPYFRAASMPGVTKRMELTGLAADYAQVQARCRILADLMAKAVSGRVLFSTGHKMLFDLTSNTAGTNNIRQDNGYLGRDAAKRVGNLPGGETYRTPNEDPTSRTEGKIPVIWHEEQLVLTVEHNQIIQVDGFSPEAEDLRKYFDASPARRNIAEFAFGCNPVARVTGNTLEDEKAGFHFAWGRSDHLGGLVGTDKFAEPSHVVHQDHVYTKESPIQVIKAGLINDLGVETMVIKNGEYIIF